MSRRAALGHPCPRGTSLILRVADDADPRLEKILHLPGLSLGKFLIFFKKNLIIHTGIFILNIGLNQPVTIRPSTCGTAGAVLSLIKADVIKAEGYGFKVHL